VGEGEKCGPCIREGGHFAENWRRAELGGGAGGARRYPRRTGGSVMPMQNRKKFLVHVLTERGSLITAKWKKEGAGKHIPNSRKGDRKGREKKQRFYRGANGQIFLHHQCLMKLVNVTKWGGKKLLEGRKSNGRPASTQKERVPLC